LESSQEKKKNKEIKMKKEELDLLLKLVENLRKKAEELEMNFLKRKIDLFRNSKIEILRIQKEINKLLENGS